MVRKVVRHTDPRRSPSMVQIYISLTVQVVHQIELNNIPDTTSAAHTTDGVAQNCLSLAGKGNGPERAELQCSHWQSTHQNLL